MAQLLRHALRPTRTLPLLTRTYNTAYLRSRPPTVASLAKQYSSASGLSKNSTKNARPVLSHVRLVSPQRLQLDWRLASAGPGDKAVAQTTTHAALWLQDHDPAHVDPDSGQKLRSSADIQHDLQLTHAVVKDDGRQLFLTWSNGQTTVYPASWLYEYADHEPAVAASLPWVYGSAARPKLWKAADLHRAGGPSIDCAAVVRDDHALWQLLQHIHEYGICFVRGVPTDSIDASVQVAARIGEIQETFYGRLWDVKSIPHAYNIAYTSGDLELHQDLEYFEAPPGLQLLHCLKNAAKGGTSTFADGFAAADTLRQHQPEHYATLVRVPVTFHYRHGEHHLRHRHPTIEEDGLNEYLRINYAPPFQGPLEAPLEQIEPFYRAFKAFAQAVNHADRVYETRLNPGDLVIFNNRRVLHGRTKFDPTTGERHLRGSYIALDGFRDRWRVLTERYLGPTWRESGDSR